MTKKRFTSWGNRIKRNGKLLNIEFKKKTDAKLCCKLCNQMDKHQQEYIDKLDEIVKWYKEYYGETILDTRMGWNDNNKISKLEKVNEQLKQDNDNLIHLLENQSMIIQELHSKLMHYELKEPIVLTKEDLELMGKAISYYSHGRYVE